MFSDSLKLLLLLLFSCSVMCDSLHPHGLQHASLPRPSQLRELAQTQVHWVSEAIQPSHPLLPPSVLALSLSQHQGLFQWAGFSHHVAKVLALQLQHEYSNEYSGLISFRIDWFDLLAVQGSLKSLLQHHSSKASILWPFSLFHCLALTSAYIAGDLGSIPGLGRSPGEGKSYPLQYSGLENSMDCISHGVTKSQTWWEQLNIQGETDASILKIYFFLLW